MVIKEKHSSNYRELCNLVDRLEKLQNDGELRNKEIYLFTDNAVAEYAYCTGNSTSPYLFDLVLRLYQLSVKGECIIHVIHIPGTLMIAIGVDGLSRGVVNEGLLSSKEGKLMNYIKLHLTAFERSRGLFDWFYSWWPNELPRIKFLNKNSWVDTKEQSEINVWSPPPAAGDAAFEFMSWAIHRRSWNMHIVIIPTAWTSLWRKMLKKMADIYLTLPPTNTVWNADQYFGLTIAFCFPLSNSSPWKFRRREGLDKLERKVLRMWERDNGSEGPILRQLCQEAWRVRSMPEILVPEMLLS